MSIKIEIKKADAVRKAGTGKNSGKDYEFFEQEGWAFLPDEPYPVRCKFTLPDDRGSTPYPAGMYELDLGKCLNVGKFDSLQLANRLVLLPVSSVGTKAA